MKYIQNRKSKGLSGSVLAAFVAAVLLLAGSSVSADSGVLAQSDTQRKQDDMMQHDRTQQQNKSKSQESGAMGSESQGFENDPFGGGPVSDKVKDYVKFVQDESVEYTTKGLKEFASAAETFIQKGDGEKELKQRRKDLEKSVGKIKDEKDPQMQAQRASQAFREASTLLTDIQQQGYPESSQVAQPVQSAADKITADKSLDMQLGEVQDFFLESGRAFNELSGGQEGIGGGPVDQPAKSSEPSQQDSMDKAPTTPTDTTKPAPENTPTGGGPSDGAAPSGGSPSGY